MQGDNLLHVLFERYKTYKFVEKLTQIALPVCI